MERRRFFAEVKGDTAIVRGSEAYHLAIVLRLKEGDEVELLTKEGIWIGRIAEVSRGKVKVSLIGRKEIGSLPYDVFLFQGITKGRRIDWLIQKASELGCKAFYPMITRYTVVSEIGEEKLRRWRRIAREASKQCGRPGVMEVHAPICLSDALKLVSDGDFLKIAPSLRGEPTPLRNLLTERRRGVAAFIGPEGGFSPEEIDLLISSGLKTVSLGPYILKSETASILVLSAILTFWGWE